MTNHVYANWHGGSSYAQGGIESIERFESVREAIDAANARYTSGHNFRQDFPYVNAEPAYTFCPCVDETATMHLFWAYPGHELGQPDMVLEFDFERGVFRSERHNMWGSLRDDVGEGFCPECEHALPHHYRSCDA